MLDIAKELDDERYLDNGYRELAHVYAIRGAFSESDEAIERVLVLYQASTDG